MWSLYFFPGKNARISVDCVQIEVHKVLAKGARLEHYVIGCCVYLSWSWGIGRVDLCAEGQHGEGDVCAGGAGAGSIHTLKTELYCLEGGGEPSASSNSVVLIERNACKFIESPLCEMCAGFCHSRDVLYCARLQSYGNSGHCRWRVTIGLRVLKGWNENVRVSQDAFCQRLDARIERKRKHCGFELSIVLDCGDIDHRRDELIGPCRRCKDSFHLEHLYRFHEA